MKNLIIQRKKTRLFLFFFFLVALFSYVRTSIFASDVSIKATISDSVPPSVPILIEPTDGALLGDNTPAFKWYGSTDNVGLSNYIFYLDGSILYDNIPLVDSDNSYYLLELNELEGIYTLTPKNAFSDGSHSWKIVAIDYAYLTASSDTWDFTIDTLAPNFVLTKIGDTTVSISAANPSTVPSSPIIIFRNDATANEPILIANGEANSSVKLTVTIPNDPTQTFTTNINGDGNYELKLGILPRDTDIRLDFIITDLVGHVSVLEKVYFRIALQYWPTATPTLTTTTTSTPTPTTTPSIHPSFTLTTKPSLSVSPSKTPTPSKSPTPTGIIPIIPPQEIIHEISGEMVEKLPKSVATSVREFLSSKLWKGLSTFFVLFILLLFYLISFLILLSKFMHDLSWSLIKKMFILMWPSFFKAKKNLVFEYKETLASSLVKVELIDQNENILDFTITNLDGNFNDFIYPKSGKWRLHVKDNNFYYPIGDKKPDQLEFWQFYQNQDFDENYRSQAILIPTLRASGQEKLPFFERLRIFVLYLLDYPAWFLIGLLLFSLIFALRYSSLYNDIALAFYSFMLLYKVLLAVSKKMKLILIAKLPGEQQFNDNLVLSFADEDATGTRSMIMPFEYSRSSIIEHSYSSVEVVAFAKNIFLEKNGLAVAGQKINFTKKEEEVILQIKRIE